MTKSDTIENIGSLVQRIAREHGMTLKWAQFTGDSYRARFKAADGIGDESCDVLLYPDRVAIVQGNAMFEDAIRAELPGTWAVI